MKRANSIPRYVVPPFLFYSPRFSSITTSFPLREKEIFDEIENGKVSKIRNNSHPKGMEKYRLKKERYVICYNHQPRLVSLQIVRH